MQNPWEDLALSTKFILPCDKIVIETYNANLPESKRNLKIQTYSVPEPFLGNFNAPVLLLLQNPGAAHEESRWDWPEDFFPRLLNSIKCTDMPHFYLSVDAPASPGRKWWESATKALRIRYGNPLIANNILAIEYFPYHSINFAHSNISLPSQNFSFYLVRKAIERKAVIVITRGRMIWTKAVPELTNYENLCYVRNPRRVSISEKNIDKYHLITNKLDKVAERDRKECLNSRVDAGTA